ncbi:CHASE2 domain-containing protein [Pseudomonadota bacterium]
MKQSTFKYKSWAILILGALLLAPQFGSNMFERLELAFFDQLQTAFPPQASRDDQNVLIVAVDEQSLQSIGQWPWPRSVTAHLIQVLHDSGAKVIGLDVLFAETDRINPDNDKALALSIANANVVVGSFNDPTARIKSIAEPAISSRLKFLGNHGKEDQDPTKLSLIYEIEGLLHNLDNIERAASGSGFLLLMHNGDGVERNVPLILNAGQTIEPSFALEVVRVAKGASHTVIGTSRSGVAHVRNENLILPMQSTGDMYLRYRPFDSSRVISALDVIEGRAEPKAFENKIVLFGATAQGLHDQVATPLGDIVPGVAVHATAIEQLMNRWPLYRPDVMHAVETCILGLLGIILIIVYAKFSPWVSFAIFLSFESILAVAAIALFTGPGIVLQPIYPGLALTIMFGGLMFLETMHTSRST